MLSHPTPSSHSPSLDGIDKKDQDFQAEYARMREELERLLSAPVKDFERIDTLVDELERVQLAFKGQHGVKGNNPNE